MKDQVFKFKLIKKVDGPVMCYTGNEIKTGDVIELSGHLAEKAKKNQNYELVKETLSVKGGN